MHAARRWAGRARDVTRDLKGEDSPAFALWSAALLGSFWSADDPASVTEEGDLDPQRIGRLDFYREWIAAGLGAPGPRVADFIHGRLQERDDEQHTALEWTVVGDSIHGQPINEL